jgi:thymidylate kinase
VSGALVLTGAPGSGKTSVLDALSTLLEVKGVGFGAVESEQLARGHPWLATADWVPQLAAVIGLQRRVGRETFLVVGTTEDEEELHAIVGAVDAHPTVVVCLSVPPELAAKRVADREPDSWPGKTALVEHARMLAGQVPGIPGLDVTISTANRDAAEVAAEIEQVLRDRGVLPQQTAAAADV